MRTQALGLRLSMLIMLVALPRTANASVVQCGNEDSSCEVSNEEGVDWVSCTCIGEGTGGDEWADFGEGELVEVCESYLMLCNGEGTGDDGGTDDGETDEGTEEGCNSDGTGDGGEVDGGEVDGQDDGGEDDGDDDGGADDPWGCSVSEGSDLGLAVSLALLGLCGLRRRTRV